MYHKRIDSGAVDAESPRENRGREWVKKWKGRKEWSGRKERENAIPGRASWDASKRIRNWYLLASISRGLISSITEFRPTGTELSVLVRATHKGRNEKKCRDSMYHMRSWWNVSPSHARWKSRDWVTGGSYVVDEWHWFWSITTTQSTQQAINNSSLFQRYEYRSLPLPGVLWELPRLYSWIRHFGLF